jgi:hypothetical protein
VPIDGFEVTRRDVLLVAQLQSTFALCLYDAVEGGGALLHLRVAPVGRLEDPDITDTTLTTDLLLLDRCLSELRRCEPRAKHRRGKATLRIHRVIHDGLSRRRRSASGFLPCTLR